MTTNLKGYTVCVLDNDHEPNHFCYPDAQSPREAIELFMAEQGEDYGFTHADIWGVYRGTLGENRGCQLMDLNQEPHFYGVYFVELSYGGSEEGGWWYEDGRTHRPGRTARSGL